MKNIFKLFLLLSFLNFNNCKKAKVTKKTEKLILEKKGSFYIEYWSPNNGTKEYERVNYENDSIYYHYGIDYYTYRSPDISNEAILCVKGKKQIVKITTDTKDSIAKLYHLKKFEFKRKIDYQDYFQYEDCILKQKVKMDSGSVHTVQAKNGAVFQVIDIMYKPILLQVCYNGKTYKERIPSGISIKNYGKLLGNGDGNIMLYDIDKDGEDELLIIMDNETKVYSYADVYKISLPK